MNFEWDPEKAQNNLRKHGVNYAEAMTVFKDPLALIFDDEEHSQEEHREIIMGTSALSRIVLVFLSNESKIPSVFSARAAQLKKRPKTMKKTPANKPRKAADISAEYHFDYKKAKPNRFAERMKDGPLVVVLDPDVAKVFTSTEEVNKALRALLAAIPEHHTISR